MAYISLKYNNMTNILDELAKKIDNISDKEVAQKNTLEEKKTKISQKNAEMNSGQNQ